MRDRPARTLSVVLAIFSHDCLTVKFLIQQADPLEIYFFCTILSDVSNKWFSTKADFVLDSIVPSSHHHLRNSGIGIIGRFGMNCQFWRDM